MTASASRGDIDDDNLLPTAASFRCAPFDDDDYYHNIGISIMNDVLGKPRQLSFPSNKGPPDRRYSSRTTDYITTAPPPVVLEVEGGEEGGEEEDGRRT
jgi:hypothetical protein